MEEKRQNLINLIFLVFFFIIFEGALRKWVFPGYQGILFFVRDPFVIIAYIYALSAGLLPRAGLFVYVSIGFTAIITIFSFFQTTHSHLPWWIIAYSWRTHFLMLPLALLIGEYFTINDLKRLFSYCLRIMPVYSVIAYYQSISPIDHWLNAGRLGIFVPLGATEGLIRTEGFFTSSVGNSIFVGMLASILLCTYLSESFKDTVSNKEKYFYTVLCSVLIVLSGQRTTFLLVGWVLLMTFLTALCISKSMLVKFLKPCFALIVLSFFLLTFVFTQHREAIKGRFYGSHNPNNVIGLDLVERTISDLTDFMNHISDRVPEMGLGIGYSSNAAYVYNITVIDLNSEAEWGRHILELGHYFGFLTILFRIFLFLYLFLLSISSAINKKTPNPVTFFSLLSTFLLMGQLTGNGIASGFIWFLVGIVIALTHSTSTEQPAIASSS